jgi:hypothetical protein
LVEKVTAIARFRDPANLHPATNSLLEREQKGTFRKAMQLKIVKIL